MYNKSNMFHFKSIFIKAEKKKFVLVAINSLMDPNFEGRLGLRKSRLTFNVYTQRSSSTSSTVINGAIK